MIENTFILLDGIGYKTEKNLWRQGILHWDDFLEKEDIVGISDNRKRNLDKELELAKFHLDNEIPYYFSYKLGKREQWRLYEAFKDRTCYLDIETTSLSSYNGTTTALSIYDGSAVKTFVRGINLDRESLAEELSKYLMVVTFYGSAFDLPFIQHEFGVRFEVPHLDLCFAGRRIGLKGGLKSIEEQVGIGRENDIQGIDGFEAARLWHRWQTLGDRASLDSLIQYNQADTVNLERLAELVYSKLKSLTLKV